MIPHSARRLNSENDYIKIIYKKMNLETNRTNYGSFKPRNIHEEAKMRSSISRQHNQYEINSKSELDIHDTRSSNDIQLDSPFVENSSTVSTNFSSKNMSKSDYQFSATPTIGTRSETLTDASSSISSKSTVYSMTGTNRIDKMKDGTNKAPKPSTTNSLDSKTTSSTCILNFII